MALLGVATGLITALVIICFRSLIAVVASQTFGSEENFEAIPPFARAGLVLGGALVLGLLLNRYRPSARRVGVVHVMERLSLHQGYLPLKNAVIQFFGGALALLTGQSGGREGPAIHLGATAASLLGRAAKLPNNSLRTMVACGTAAAIASCFNTPIAGVIFAMEVVMMEYTIASFIPVIVAAVSATLITLGMFGAAPAFDVAPQHAYSLFEIIYLVLGGLVIGIIAAGYIQLTQAFARLSLQPVWRRLTLAGALTAGVGFFLPQVMGLGYDTVNEIMNAELSIVLLVLLLTGKALTSAAAVGLGMPVGLIGPTMFMGAAFGGVFGNLLIAWHGPDISIGFYVMLGMCAMMAAILQAPLAALMAVVELTANTGMVLPAMVIIVIATLTSSEIFKQRSVYITTLNTLGLQYPPNPVTLHMQRVGVTAIMDRAYIRVAHAVTVNSAREILQKKPNWIVVENEDSILSAVLNPADLEAFMTGRDFADEELIRLLSIPGRRMDVSTIGAEATVLQVQEMLEKTGTEACCVTRTTAPLINPMIGLVTQREIENYRNTSQ